MSETSTQTPKQVDAKLAELHGERAKHQATIKTQQAYLLRYSGAVQIIQRGRRVWSQTPAEAEAIIRDKGPQHSADALVYGVKRADEAVQRILTRIDAARSELEVLVEQIDEQNKLYTGWSRFFLVTSSAGHIHSSLHCSSCYATTQYGWLPELSDESEADAVNALGSRLCTVCFPSAPADSGTFTVAQAEKIAKGGLSEAAKILEKEAAKAASCEGSGGYFLSALPHRTGFYSGNYGTCAHCNQRVTISSTGKLRKHANSNSNSN